MDKIHFHEITLEDKEWMDEKLAYDQQMACEYTFGNNFVWRKIYQVEVAKINDCGVIRFRGEEGYCYSYPFGPGNKTHVIENLLLLAHENKEALRLLPLSENNKKEVEKWFPGQFLFLADRDSFDYIYDREKLATLKGKKLHGKRNHIARFKDGNDWLYEEITEENLDECRKMTYEWIRMREEVWNAEMEAEMTVLHEAFDHRKELGFRGGLLRKQGKIVAVSMGEPLNDQTFVVHFEKAYPDMQGAYPMINQQFVLHECEKYQYVNREEDTGVLGLRKAKLSYYPEILLKKYVAQESEVVWADIEGDRLAIINLWKDCFEDEEIFIQFYLQQRCKEDTMLVICRDGKPVSMASFLDAQYQWGEESIPVKYVYAVGTLTEYRGQKLAEKILRTAMQIFKCPLVLAPAEERLKEYYERMGFQTAFTGKKHLQREWEMLTEEEEENIRVAMQEVSSAEYYACRNQKLSNDGYIKWDEQAIAYAIEYYRLTGGNAYKIEDDILLYGVDGRNLVLIETTLEEDDMWKVLSVIIKENGLTGITFADSLDGMMWLPKEWKDKIGGKTGYLGLTLG